MKGEPVPPDLAKPYWVDELVRKHEAYRYGESDARNAHIPVDGRLVGLIVPTYVPEFEPSFVRMADDTLLTGGIMIPEDNEEDWNEEGSGIILIARRLPDREPTFCTVIAHEVYPETMELLVEARHIGLASGPTHEEIAISTPPSGGTDG
jgi:hypothetical protein